MAAKRPGQVRFEAWVPESLYEQFQATKVNRAQWLRAAIASFVGEEADTSDSSAPEHRHRRVQVGVRYSLGTEIPRFECSECGRELT